MPVRTIQVVEDSFDGKPLEGPTEPIVLTVGRRTWNLYLSTRNQEKFYDTIKAWTQNEEPVADPVENLRRQNRPLASKKSNKRDPEQIKHVRQWAIAEDIRYKGKPLADRGRIPEEVYKAYEDAH